MLAKDGNGTTDFKNGNEDGWPARRRKDQVRRLEKEKTLHKRRTHHAMGNVTNNDIN